MSLKLKSFLLISLLLIFVPSSLGTVDVLHDVETTHKSIFKVRNIQMKARKLMALDVQDYDDTKANNKHDPKKPGNGKP